MLTLLRRWLFKRRLLSFTDNFDENVPLWQGATWSILAGRAVNTPLTVGGELLTDGGLEAWTSATNLTNWTESIAGTSTVNRDGVDQRTGNFCARFDIDAANSVSQIFQNVNAVLPNWYVIKCYAKNNGVASSIQFSISGNSIVIPLTNSYALYTHTNLGRSTPGQTFILRGIANGASIYIDDATHFQLSTPTLPRVIQFSTQYFATCKAGWTVGVGLQAGVIANLDSLAAPANFVLAIHNRTNAQLWKCVAGTYTKLIDAAAAYAADRIIEIRRPTGNTYSLWYNGSQIGTNQTISDAGIINNKKHGLFSTGDGNSCASFTFTGVQ